jgi:hypothetical protein
MWEASFPGWISKTLVGMAMRCYGPRSTKEVKVPHNKEPLFLMHAFVQNSVLPSERFAWIIY